MTNTPSNTQKPTHNAPWMIVGLGNPGPKYQNTRHNIGFMVLDAFAHRHLFSFSENKRAKAWVGTVKLNTPEPTTLIGVKPLTYMNLSGQAVASLSAYYNIPPEHILVVVDDVALPVGKLRVRPKGTHGGQNGLKSIIQSLGNTNEFPRLRLGIGSPHPNQPLEKYVLETFRSEALTTITQVIEASIDCIETIIGHGVESAMSQYNGLNFSPEQSTPS